MKHTEQIMALADAYASQLQVCNFDDADKARAALEAAVLAQGEPVGINGLTEAETAATASVMGLVAPEAKQEALLDSTVPPHALYYPLSDYHRAPAEGPLNFTWIDKPHRLLYDLIAAVKFYANPAPVNQALLEALKEIEWSNNSKWQSDRARAAIAAAEGKI